MSDSNYHGPGGVRLVTWDEFQDDVRHDRRFEKLVVVVGAIFDLTVVVLALDRIFG